MEGPFFQLPPVPRAGKADIIFWWRDLEARCQALDMASKSTTEKMEYVRELAEFELSIRLVAILLGMGYHTVVAEAQKLKLRFRGSGAEGKRRNTILNRALFDLMSPGLPKPKADDWVGIKSDEEVIDKHLAAYREAMEAILKTREQATPENIAVRASQSLDKPISAKAVESCLRQYPNFERKKR